MHFSFEFDNVLTKKVPRSATLADFRTFLSFAIARYAIYFWSARKYFLFY